MAQINRRDFIAAAAVACACVVCPLPQWAQAAGKLPVDIGPLADFKLDGVWDKWAASGFIIVHTSGTLYALCTRCPHQGGMIRVDPDNQTQLKCSRHGARFNDDGAVTKGPARQGLVRLGIEVNASGHVIVDPSSRFGHDKADTSGSFVKA